MLYFAALAEVVCLEELSLDVTRQAGIMVRQFDNGHVRHWTSPRSQSPLSQSSPSDRIASILLWPSMNHGRKCMGKK